MVDHLDVVVVGQTEAVGSVLGHVLVVEHGGEDGTAAGQDALVRRQPRRTDVQHEIAGLFTPGQVAPAGLTTNLIRSDPNQEWNSVEKLKKNSSTLSRSHQTL